MADLKQADAVCVRRAITELRGAGGRELTLGRTRAGSELFDLADQLERLAAELFGERVLCGICNKGREHWPNCPGVARRWSGCAENMRI